MNKQKRNRFSVIHYYLVNIEENKETLDNITPIGMGISGEKKSRCDGAVFSCDSPEHGYNQLSRWGNRTKLLGNWCKKVNDLTFALFPYIDAII